MNVLVVTATKEELSIALDNHDYLSELGAQEGSRFLTPEEMNLEMKNRVQMPKRTQLKSVRGITVNTVHGD